GGVAPFMAIAAVPLAGMAGAAVDYTRANTVKAAMQASLDSAGLMLSKDGSQLSAAELTQKTQTYFTALFQRPEAQNLQLTQTISSPQQGSFQLDLTASATVTTTFAAMMGINQINVH